MDVGLTMNYHGETEETYKSEMVASNMNPHMVVTEKGIIKLCPQIVNHKNGTYYIAVAEDGCDIT